MQSLPCQFSYVQVQTNTLTTAMQLSTHSCHITRIQWFKLDHLQPSDSINTHHAFIRQALIQSEQLLLEMNIMIGLAAVRVEQNCVNTLQIHRVTGVQHTTRKPKVKLSLTDVSDLSPSFTTMCDCTDFLVSHFKLYRSCQQLHTPRKPNHTVPHIHMCVASVENNTIAPNSFGRTQR